MGWFLSFQLREETEAAAPEPQIDLEDLLEVPNEEQKLKLQVRQRDLGTLSWDFKLGLHSEEVVACMCTQCYMYTCIYIVLHDSSLCLSMSNVVRLYILSVERGEQINSWNTEMTPPWFCFQEILHECSNPTEVSKASSIYICYTVLEECVFVAASLNSHNIPVPNTMLQICSIPNGKCLLLYSAVLEKYM